ncbi:MAG: hypothetical protein LBM74_09970 [Oscillospiraceae bacterium]|jgi:hypothetical protein|nr:hypothetical protein [Oscillospiraceae bacterium]
MSNDNELAQTFSSHLTKQGFDIVLNDLSGYVDNKRILDCDVLIALCTKEYANKYGVDELIYYEHHSKTLSRRSRIVLYLTDDYFLSSGHDMLLHFDRIMGSFDIRADAKKMANKLRKINVEILAEREEEKQKEEAAREVAAQKVEAVKGDLSEYTKEVFERLKKNEKRNRHNAVVFYVLAIAFLGLAFVYSLLRIKQIALDTTVLQSISYIVSNVLTLAIVVALSRLAFILGKAFMTNALRNEDRIHALSFGEFFIKAYGEEASHEEVRAVFSDWNIDKGTSFHSQNASEYDPMLMNAFETIKAALLKKTEK